MAASCLSPSSSFTLQPQFSVNRSLKPVSLSWRSSIQQSNPLSINSVSSNRTLKNQGFVVHAAWTRRSRSEAEKRPNKKSWKQRTDMYMRPFQLNVFFSKRFIHAKVMHRGTSKVISVATTNAKDLRNTLPSLIDNEACRVIGRLIAERSKEADVFAVPFEANKNERIEGSVTPTGNNSNSHHVLSQSSPVTGATSRLRRKFSWLTSSSSRASSSDASVDRVIASRDARKLKAELIRNKSSAQRALGGLRFISKTTNTDVDDLWKNVESRFVSLAKDDGLLAREDFAECIGMSDSKEFALGVFDALARRRQQKLGKITKTELHEFWLQISDQRFDARLQIFFDIVIGLNVMTLHIWVFMV